MKIAILTVPFNNNYGGFLQAFALKTVLQSMGHDVIFLMRERNRMSRYQRVRGFVGWLLGRRSQCYYSNQYHIYKISKNTRRFVNRYIAPLSKSCYTTESFTRMLRSCDADVFIAGSDQCWRYKFTPSYVDDYFYKGLLGTNKRRISYAASLGTEELEYDDEMRKSCMRCLKEFSAISVREDSALPLLEKYFGVPVGFAKETLDPTLLLTVDKYKELMKGFPPGGSNYLFSYILDETEDKSKLIEKILNKYNLEWIDQKAQTGDIHQLHVIEPVELWLSRIYHSSFVVTDSFHGMVFSIIFNRPFIIYGNKLRGKARIDSILRKFDLQDCYLENSEQLSFIRGIDEFDWNSINKALIRRKEESFKFLKDSLTKTLFK